MSKNEGSIALLLLKLSALPSVFLNNVSSYEAPYVTLYMTSSITLSYLN